MAKDKVLPDVHLLHQAASGASGTAWSNARAQLVASTAQCRASATELAFRNGSADLTFRYASRAMTPHETDLPLSAAALLHLPVSSLLNLVSRWGGALHV